ncbi:MAG: PEP-CTERM sorting domain-containing protein [Salinisphaera sp.]|uniref:PEP-CTERM sorting domain-containing protein n=1 Tax=Salinisphaera sp. TaxID=1914330 RepID=UPI003C7A16E4
MAAAYSGASSASIIYDSLQPAHGTGFGTQDNILTLRSNRAVNGVETGKVAWNGTQDHPTGAQVDSNSGKTATFTFGSLGITNAGQILLTWNPNEKGNTNGQKTRVDSLFLSIYAPNGSVLTTQSLAAPVTHNTTPVNPGLGGDGFAYLLDTAGISSVNSALFGINGGFNDYRLGLESQISFADAGPDTWIIGSRPYDPGVQVPEPSSAGLLGLAVLGIALTRLYAVRRRTYIE